MAIIIETTSGFEKINSGHQTQVNQNGHLTIVNGGGRIVAAYAAGTWMSAVTEGDREFSNSSDFS